MEPGSLLSSNQVITISDTKIMTLQHTYHTVFPFTATTKQTSMAAKPGTVESITEVLSQYGPWGYLMLGMLICGTVLMFCGLWECCFRRPKTHEDEPPPSHPTTVLIINQSEEETSRPPSYEELDQPPPYNTLFPHVVKVEDTVVSESQTERQSSDAAIAESSGSAVVVVSADETLRSEDSDNRTHED